MTKKMLKTLEKTKYAGCNVVAVAADPQKTENDEKHIGIDKLIEVGL